LGWQRAVDLGAEHSPVAGSPAATRRRARGIEPVGRVTKWSIFQNRGNRFAANRYCRGV